jgi:hypothetical protein
MKIKFCLAVFLVLLVNACSLSPKNPPPTEIASIYPNPTSKAPSPIATNLVPLPTPISPLVVTQIVTEAPTGNPVIPPPLSTSTLPIPTTFQFSDGQYMDDRGSEYQFLLSYFNAIRQRLLPMAYYFWNDDPTLAGSYESFVQAHSRLNPDEITVMKAGSSGAAGSIYTTFGVTLKGSKSGVPTSWAGCFTIRTPNPALFDSKDYHSRHLIAERLLEIHVGESPKATLETACAGMDFGMLEISLSNSDSIAWLMPSIMLTAAQIRLQLFLPSGMHSTARNMPVLTAILKLRRSFLVLTSPSRLVTLTPQTFLAESPRQKN